MRFYRRSLALVLAMPAAALAQPSVPSVPPALIERFIAVLPDSRQLETTDRTVDAELLQRFAALNPGREPAVRTILEDYQGCVSTVTKSRSREVLRGVGQELGEAKVLKIIAFYEGSAFARYIALGEQARAGRGMSATEQAESISYLETYPLEDFAAAMLRVSAALFGDETFGAAARACEQARQAAFARDRLRQPR